MTVLRFTVPFELLTQTVRLANYYERLGLDPLGVGVGVPQVRHIYKRLK
jgi:hypothetical protein